MCCSCSKSRFLFEGMLQSLEVFFLSWSYRLSIRSLNANKDSFTVKSSVRCQSEIGILESDKLQAWDIY